FADEKVLETIAHLVPGITYWIVPVFLMPLSLFVCFIQTFVFVLLSQLYISEVSHPPHEEHGHPETENVEHAAAVAAALGFIDANSSGAGNALAHVERKLTRDLREREFSQSIL